MLSQVNVSETLQGRYKVVHCLGRGINMPKIGLLRIISVGKMKYSWK